MRLRTDRERAVWAAVYAMHVEGRMFDAPAECSIPGNEDRWARYEVGVAVQACNRADAAVERLREALAECKRTD